MKKIFFLILILFVSVSVSADSTDEYTLYLKRLNGVKTIDEISQNNFYFSLEQVFETEFDHFGKVKVIPACDTVYNRLVIFISDLDGNIVYRTEDFESNNIRRGELYQNNYEFQAIAFWDLNKDGKRDITIIGLCKNANGEIYKTGDVLFQNEDGFYRDWRISDKINRFDMNKGVFMIAAFVRDGYSTEFLYTAKTLDELYSNGFVPLKYTYELILDVNFESFGNVNVVCGTYFMADHFIFMAYIADKDGKILWNFQPSNKYDNFSNLRGISFPDINGNGLKDIIFVIRNINLSESWDSETVDDYVIYYQKSGYFEEDHIFKESTNITNYEINNITDIAKEFWSKTKHEEDL